MPAESTWDQQKRAARRERYRSLSVLLVIGFVLVAAAYYAVHRLQDGDSSESVASREVPGFDDDGRSLDTTPFSQAGPGEIGATTLPGFDDPLDPTTTTTTALPATTIPALPAAGQDPACQAAISLGQTLTASGLGGDEPTIPDDLPETFLRAADLVAATNEAAFQPIVFVLRSMAADLADTTSPAEVKMIVTPLLAPTDPQVASALQALIGRTQGSCPGLDRGLA